MSYLFVIAARSGGTIRKTIYGNFVEHLGRCIYGGIADQDGALRPAVLQALKTLHIPVLRWPGGCFADTYHWRDGIGPRSERKTIINTNWGGVTENNAFGTHEFLSLCEQLGCEAYLSGNVGSGTVQEFSDWVEYCNMPGVSPMADLRRRNGREAPFGVRYWGIGNEAWGCGGTMRAEYYADLCRQYATYLRSYDAGLVPYKIASGANVDDYHWTRTVVERAGQCIDAVSLHYYTVPGPDWQHKGSATDFDRDAYYTTLHKTLRMEELVENHSRIIRRFAKGRPIGLCVDEWGTWYDVEPGTNPGFLYQQNTMRDALVAAVNLNIFNNHCPDAHQPCLCDVQRASGCPPAGKLCRNPDAAPRRGAGPRTACLGQRTVGRHRAGHRRQPQRHRARAGQLPAGRHPCRRRHGPGPGRCAVRPQHL